AAQGRVVVPKVHRQDSKEPPERDEDQTRARIAVNTIAGGFSGGVSPTTPGRNMLEA
ncbi:hypothetical protein L195_g062202, partial [Trifolium pratense]